MTTHVDHLSLIAKTIETQYDLARIELFRPLEIYDRWNGIKATDVAAEGGWGCACKPRYQSDPTGRFAGTEAQWRDLSARVAPMRDACQEIALTYGVNARVEVYRNVATCACADRKPIIRYSVRVSITWNGRTLMREYALPELPENREVDHGPDADVSTGALSGKMVGPGRLS